MGTAAKSILIVDEQHRPDAVWRRVRPSRHADPNRAAGPPLPRRAAPAALLNTVRKSCSLMVQTIS